MSIIDLFNSNGFIIIAISIIGLFGIALRSRCQRTNCCYGLIEIIRDTQAEDNERMRELELQSNNNTNNNNLSNITDNSNNV